MNIPVSRKEALAQGSKHYFTGVPCKRGHLRERLSSNGNCLSCSRKHCKTYRSTPEGQEIYNKANRRWRKTPKARESQRKIQSLWQKTAKGKASSRRQKFLRSKRYRAATPQWCDVKAMSQFVSNCPEGHHVDHILPLAGETVCGLNVPENLQYLPAHENISKSNKIDPLTLEANVCVLPDHREYVAPLGLSGS